MEQTIEEQLEHLNRLYKEQDDIYRGVAAKIGLSDAAFWILYAICETEQVYTQNDLCNGWFYSKQTINSACNNLIKYGYIVLEPIPDAKNRKAITLTESGEEFCKQNVLTLIAAEKRSFLRFDKKEREVFLSLLKKQNEFLKEELQKDAKDKIDKNSEKQKNGSNQESGKQQ